MTNDQTTQQDQQTQDNEQPTWTHQDLYYWQNYPAESLKNPDGFYTQYNGQDPVKLDTDKLSEDEKNQKWRRETLSFIQNPVKRDPDKLSEDEQTQDNEKPTWQHQSLFMYTSELPVMTSFTAPTGYCIDQSTLKIKKMDADTNAEIEQNYNFGYLPPTGETQTSAVPDKPTKNERDPNWRHSSPFFDRETKLKTQVGGTHYHDLDIEPLEVMQAVLTPTEYLGFIKGSIIKYGMRQGKKPESDDVGKARDYIRMKNEHNTPASE